MATVPPVRQLKGRQLGRVLIKMGVLTRDKVHEALKVQKKQGGDKKLGEVLKELDLITDQDLKIALAGQKGLEFCELGNVAVPDKIIEKLPSETARNYRAIPIEFNAGRNELVVVVDNAENFRTAEDLGTVTGHTIVTKIADESEVEEALERYYPEQNESMSEILGEIEADGQLLEMDGRDASIDLDELQELADSSPVKRLLNLVLLQAIRDGAADIHFEPFEDEFKMRYRIDGVLYEMVPPPKHIAVALASRIKVMADLDIAERRLPQDGRIPLTVAGRPVDLRVSILPTMFGESVVLRILDRAQVNLDISKLGFREREENVFRQLIHKPNGIVVVTGPTGCGKTTTLYSALKDLNTVGTKIITTEDPVEYDIDGLMQVQINSDIGLTFPRCLRSILRQDPDIVMVGEIRDLDTAKIAIEASLTGHLVLTTVHTNDAPSTIARLVDLGLEHFLVTASLEGVVAQRLVRKVCLNCKTQYDPSEEELMELDLTPEDVKDKKFFYGKGCEKCNKTGFKGRLGLFEIMSMDDELRDLIMNQASTNILRDAARKSGMKLLRENGLELIFDGQTTISEVARETMIGETG
ncbi:Type II traffic warden ATPase [Anaerohalosphaera lusitana]|uniref:Type II traffic warden ATPase n=1 Tax=Anaerohalosphaera lusitana TaxID=1936003 RepID=A0A1U9NLR5_9BACT|nr:ATPase, T2SS/T4P/T4SS family [Anaerohalosphaera lusitana]AQT68520.1 Type II traffic warden ATPase [Anaerohalosphaera lusitana]